VSTWNTLKNKFNEEKEISASIIYNRFSEAKGTKSYKDLGTVTASTVRNYLKTLVGCGFISREYKHLSDKNLYVPASSVYILKYKIPDKLTYNEARKLSKNPWMIWFKYPEIHMTQKRREGE
jgi:hypothetical protein